MNTDCEAIEALFSALFDEALDSHQRRWFDSHLVECAACRESWREYADAVHALGSLGPATGTDEQTRSAILAAVDAAAVARPSRVGAVASHTIATLLGAAAAIVVFWLWRGNSPAAATAPTVRVVEVPVEVRVPFERIVEVPVDRVVHERVEVPVEVPVERERIVRRGPLVAVDFASLDRFVQSMRSVLVDGARELVAVHSDPTDDDPGDDESRTRRPGLSPVRELLDPPQLTVARGPGSTRATVRVERVADRVRLRTRGVTSDLVPVLLANLNGSDTEVSALIERRLNRIHNRVAADPSVGSRLKRPPSRVAAEAPGGGRAANWREWWAANSSWIAAADSAPRSIPGTLAP